MTRVYKVQMFVETSEHAEYGVKNLCIAERTLCPPPCVYIVGDLTKIFSTISLRSFSMDKTYLVMQSQGNFMHNGEEKKPGWMSLGIMPEKADGKRSIKLNALPLPNKDGEIWPQCFEPKKEQPF